MELPESTFNKIIDIAHSFYNERNLMMPEWFCSFPERKKLNEKDLEEKYIDWKMEYSISNTLNVMKIASIVSMQMGDDKTEPEQNPICDDYQMSPFSNECMKCGHEDIMHFDKINEICTEFFPGVPVQTCATCGVLEVDHE